MKELEKLLLAGGSFIRVTQRSTSHSTNTVWGTLYSTNQATITSNTTSRATTTAWTSYWYPVTTWTTSHATTTAWGTSWTTNKPAVSDPRLKENFSKFADPFRILNGIEGGTFTWKHGFALTEGKWGRRDAGVLADQVAAVLPEIVVETAPIDGEVYKMVDYAGLTPVLIEAVKQLSKRVEKLELESKSRKSRFHFLKRWF